MTANGCSSICREPFATAADGLGTAEGDALGDGTARPGLGDGTTDAAGLGLGDGAAAGACDGVGAGFGVL
jgi:hypothetical protein